jgi:hypothetical protein
MLHDGNMMTHLTHPNPNVLKAKNKNKKIMLKFVFSISYRIHLLKKE